MAGIELEPIPGKPAARGYAVFLKCLEKGRPRTRYGDILALSPPLIVTEAQIEEIVGTLRFAIESATFRRLLLRRRLRFIWRRPASFMACTAFINPARVVRTVIKQFAKNFLHRALRRRHYELIPHWELPDWQRYPPDLTPRYNTSAPLPADARKLSAESNPRLKTCAKGMAQVSKAVTTLSLD
jgi:hypothetical protein